MASAPRDALPSIELSINGSPDGYVLRQAGRSILQTCDPDQLLYAVEKEITVGLQRRRPDLVFLHAAAVEFGGRAFLLAAESGTGKSTTTWALLHHGYGYLSDELSPVQLESMQVYPYPHALCFKSAIPSPYPLPATAIDLGRTLHVPAHDLPPATGLAPLPAAALLLLNHCPGLDAPAIRALGHGEASARLYVNVLNALSHPNCGLEATARITERVPCFLLSCAELAATCALIESTVEQVISVAG